MQHRRPSEVDEQTADRQHRAGDEDRAGDVGRVPALRPDREHAADEGRRRTEVARHPAVDDQQEDDRRDAAHHDGELRVEPHDDGEDERRAEHRDHVLCAQADGARPGKPLVRADHSPGGGVFPPWTTRQPNPAMCPLLAKTTGELASRAAQQYRRATLPSVAARMRGCDADLTGKICQHVPARLADLANNPTRQAPRIWRTRSARARSSRRAAFDVKGPTSRSSFSIR